ncbi:MAG: AIPR family protein [Clostridia bacterium]|nr:AIPR family protein [Clostridia bacterium]
MPINSNYAFIKNKIDSMKTTYPILRTESDDYVFSALCVRSHLYKNPALLLSGNDFEEIIVDGQYDGGVDVLLTDPSSEGSDLVIGQSKYYTSISFDDVINAMTKMASFYKDMIQGHYEQVNAKVQRRFLSLNSELGEESKIHFVFYTSAPQSGISRLRIEKKFRELFTDSSQFEISLFFGKDIEDEIKESESRRATVEQGKVKIDSSNNYLLYGDTAAIVNVSAFSIKSLYAQYNIQLLARNLRYHIAGRDIDAGIEETIRTNPESFWLKNNGITIVCEDFEIDGREVKLRNFSIINGGQTTYMLHKSRNIDENNDLYLPCKIIKTEGETEDEKNAFSLSIAKATNTQKPIKPVDLKANSPEQVRFAQAMREVGIFYQTKRGEVVPRAYREDCLNSSLLDIGKLCLAAIFQLPCISRSKPSTLYVSQYYDKIFNGNQVQIARLSKELLYIDYYFRKNYQKKFDRDNAAMPGANERISFAHNARTICIAFVAFASRYYQGNIADTDLNTVFAFAQNDNVTDSRLFDLFSNIGGVVHFIPIEIFNQKDKYDSILDQLFDVIINAGITSFSMASRYDTTLTATNYLKKDRNYYAILSDHWSTIRNDIRRIFSDIM